MAEFFANYSMLVINSFGLQNAMERCPVDIPHFFARVHSSAKTCAILVREELGPSDFLKYAPDSHFVFTSYAILSLLKVSSGGSMTGSHLMHKSATSPRISGITRSRTRDAPFGQRGGGDIRPDFCRTNAYTFVV
jgi:hypothetical protein